MLRQNRRAARNQEGFSLLEVLVTMLVLAVGLLGLAALQSRTLTSSIEAHQRAEASAVLQDMASRIGANGSNAASYVSASAYGTGDAEPASCTALAYGAARDLCEWSSLLKGSAELSNSNILIGAMNSARGCIAQVQAPNPTTGICTPGIYQVTVVWGGMTPTVVPASACGSGSYGANDAYRRAISARVVVPQNACSS